MQVIKLQMALYEIETCNIERKYFLVVFLVFRFSSITCNFIVYNIEKNSIQIIPELEIFRDRSN